MYIIDVKTLKKLDTLELSNNFIDDYEAIKNMLYRCPINLDYVGLYLENDNEYDAVSLIFKYHALYHMGDNNEDTDTHMHRILQDSLMNYDFRHIGDYEKLDDAKHDRVRNAISVFNDMATKYRLWSELSNDRVYRLLYLLMDEYENRVD